VRLINRLRNPGEIRSVWLETEKVTVRLVNDEIIIYERIENEEIPTEGEGPHRRGSLH